MTEPVALIITKIIIPLIFGVAGATIVFLGRRWWETRILETVPDDANIVTSEWDGQFMQEDEDPNGKPWIPTNFSMSLTARWKRVSGTITIDDKHTLKCSGGFYQARVLTMHYWSENKGTLQSGVFLFQLSGTADVLSGFFVGYGPISEGLVRGSVTLVRRGTSPPVWPQPASAEGDH